MENPEEIIKNLTAENKKLQKQVDTLTTENGGLIAVRDELKQANVTLNENAVKLQGQFDLLTTEHNALKESHDLLITESTNEIQRLSQAVDSKPEVQGGNLVVTVYKRRFTVIGKQFNLGDDKIITAEELIKDKQLLEELVDKGVGFLHEIQ